MAKKPKPAPIPQKPRRLEHLPSIPNGKDYRDAVNALVDAVNELRLAA